jgi:hypothetical protein
MKRIEVRETENGFIVTIFSEVFRGDYQLAGVQNIRSYEHVFSNIDDMTKFVHSLFKKV